MEIGTDLAGEFKRSCSLLGVSCGGIAIVSSAFLNSSASNANRWTKIVVDLGGQPGALALKALHQH